MTYIPDYADSFEERVQEAREIAQQAKSKGGDPRPEVEIPVAEDMAERCEKLLEREYGDKIHGLAEQIRDLESSEKVDGREEMSLYLAEEFATGALSEDFDNNAERVEAAIRTCVAILTEGVVAAPIEGIGKVKIEPNDDGETEFIRIPYFGPIRSAGGTAQAVSVLVADYVRDLLDIAVFQPREEEVERYVEEIHLYDSQVGMQYCPPKDKARYIIKHIPIMVDGQPNLQAVGREVDGYRDLERIDGNAPRDGMCLVMAEGIGLKAPKLKRYSEAFGLDSWSWMDKLIQGSGDDEDEDEDTEENENESESEKQYDVPLRADEATVLDAKKKFMSDALAGRPIFAGASQEGGFRLRYGRPRNSGHAAVGFSPATMRIAHDFIAPSTQLKTERPGKAAGAVPADELEGPTVRLNNGTVTRIDSGERAKKIQDNVDKILDLGEIGIPYGEFVENNHPLAPATYAPEWWAKELEQAGGDPSKINHREITPEKAIQLSKQYNIPLHPEYTYLWHDINPEEYASIRAVLDEAEKEDDLYILNDGIAEVLEKLLVPHKQNIDHIELDEGIYNVLNDCVREDPVDDDVLGQINEYAPYTIRPRSLTRIGARMGRPEKAEKREMKPTVNSLFPIRDTGTDERRIDKAVKHEENADYSIDGTADNGKHKQKGIVEAQVNYRECPNCNKSTFQAKCPDCDIRTEQKLVCSKCGRSETDAQPGDGCPSCGDKFRQATKREFNLKKHYEDALDNIDERETSVGKVKAVKRLTSDSKIPEPLEKGLLRSKYDISTFRDGTARYDMCDLPLTSFKPSEVGITVEKVKELGYEETVDGEPITSLDDLIEIKMQDVIVAQEAGDYLLDVANYIDELLVKYYDMEPYYEAETKEDMVGELLIGMAPHTSAGVVGRLLGFTDASANYAHPFFHAAKRRNCFHPETELTVKINGDWQRLQIQELVETYLEPDSEGYDDTYDDGTVVQEIQNHPHIEELKVPSMTDEGHRTIENVTHLSKHQAPDHMINVNTEDGSEITITPDHKSPVKGTDQLIKTKKAHKLEEGDLLFDYSSEKVENVKNYEEIDVLEYLLTKDHNIDLDRVMIRGLRKDKVYDLLTEEIKPKWDDGQFYKMSSSCEYLNVTKTSLDNYLRRESIPVTLFETLYQGDTDKILEKLPNNCKIGINSDNMKIPRIITLDEELACFIGYYSAEGYCRTEEDTRVETEMDSLNQVDFAATESEARDFIERVLDKKFNVENPYKNENRFTASGKLLKYFFSEILDAGDGCYEKKIPKQIMKGSRKIKKQYLSGYVSGDGGAVFGGSMLQAYTVSEELKNNIEELISDLEIDVTFKVKEPELLRDRFPDFYEEDDNSMSAKGYEMRISEIDWAYLSETTGFQLSRKNRVEKKYDTKKITDIEYISESPDNVYNMTVSYTHRIQASQALRNQCDGDEDSVMLLMDGLINFSRKYLPSQRGKNMMDAPIVMSTILDPEEIDDEAHNVDIVEEYPLEFFESTMHAVDPDDAPIEIAEDRLDEPVGFKHSLGASDINAGPSNTAYKSVDGMDDATKKQMDLAEATRGVDEKKVASMVVEKHFFPDIIGNITAFARQEFQCANNHMHRRAPASGRCTERDWCDAEVRPTVYEGMVNKYVESAKDLADDYDLTTYTKQRLEALDDRIESVFNDDKEEQTGLDDFL